MSDQKTINDEAPSEVTKSVQWLGGRHGGAVLLTGGCLCGAFRYKLTSTPKTICTCHCKNCQRLSGSAFSMAVLVPTHAWQTNRGLVVRRENATDDSTKSRWLCAACNTWLFGGPRLGSSPPDTVRFIRAGTLDDTSWLRPTVHFWTCTAQPWVVLPQNDLAFATQPPDLATWAAQNA